MESGPALPSPGQLASSLDSIMTMLYSFGGMYRSLRVELLRRQTRLSLFFQHRNLEIST